MSAMSHVIRPVESVDELAEVLDVKGTVPVGPHPRRPGFR